MSSDNVSKTKGCMNEDLPRCLLPQLHNPPGLALVPFYGSAPHPLHGSARSPVLHPNVHHIWWWEAVYPHPHTTDIENRLVYTAEEGEGRMN